jgi:hypothetical protein
MARLRSKPSPTGHLDGCVDVGPEIRAAIDAGDGSSVAAILRARPEPPACIDPDRSLFDWFGFLAIGSETEPFLLDLGRPGLWGRIGECSTCKGIAVAIARHPLLVGDSPPRARFIASFSKPPESADVTSMEVSRNG